MVRAHDTHNNVDTWWIRYTLRVPYQISDFNWTRPGTIDFGQIHKCAHSLSLPQYPSFSHHTWRHCEQWSSLWERMVVLQQFYKNIDVTAIFLKTQFKKFKSRCRFAYYGRFHYETPLAGDLLYLVRLLVFWSKTFKQAPTWGTHQFSIKTNGGNSHDSIEIFHTKSQPKKLNWKFQKYSCYIGKFIELL